MSLIAFIIIGFVAGLLARAIMPGRQHMGLVMTTVLGVVGSFVGGLLSHVFLHRGYDTIHPVGIIGSVIGALIVLGVWGAVSHRRGGLMPRV